MFLWDDRAIEALKKYWPTEMPASEIAEKLGATSKSAVIGKAHRLGLATRVVGKKPSAHHRKGQLAQVSYSPKVKAKVASAGGREAWVEQKMKAGPILKPIPEPRPRRDLPPLVARVSFDDLEAEHCRFPVGEPGRAGFGFCGEKRLPGRPYCACCTERSTRRSEAA